MSALVSLTSIPTFIELVKDVRSRGQSIHPAKKLSG